MTSGTPVSMHMKLIIWGDGLRNSKRWLLNSATSHPFMEVVIVNDVIPSEEEWGDWQQDVDQRFAHDTYIGRSTRDMQDRFVHAPIEAASELQFMPPIPFRYYIIGFRDSVMSDKHDEVSKANSASCFLRLVYEKLRTDRDAIMPVIDKLMPTAEHIARNQDQFNAETDIYGDFYEIFRLIQSAERGS